MQKHLLTLDLVRSSPGCVSCAPSPSLGPATWGEAALAARGACVSSARPSAWEQIRVVQMVLVLLVFGHTLAVKKLPVSLLIS